MFDELIKRLIETSVDFGESDDVSVMMIEAANAIEELQKITTHYEEESKGWWLAACDAKEERERLKEQIPKWIPVTERLPNCNGCYLVWIPHFFGGEIGMPSICYFDGSNTWHDSYGVDFERILHPDDVTHWMPLPQPPETKN